MGRSDLIAAFQDTLTMSFAPTLKDATEQASQSSRVYFENFHSDKVRRNLSGTVIVEENTTFAAAKKYLAVGKTAVLNFANPVSPGGGVQNGAMAQEECLCRSSNLYACLTFSAFADYYQYNREFHNHFFSDRLIYTEGVTVFKDDATVPVLMPEREWFQVDVITCAAPFLAKRRYTNKAALRALFRDRIKNIFESAIEYNIDVLILGAFGCGAFRNPPDIVSMAFKEVIDENQYETQFKKIVFAIKSTVSDGSDEECPNITAFRAAFMGVPVDSNKLRFADSWATAQSTGSIRLPSGPILKGGNRYNDYLEWVFKNKYFGKQFSILGDSISTLEGYNPMGYSVFYTGDACERSGVMDMKDTWWGKIIDYFGAELLVNNSWSGSRVTKIPGRDTLFPSGCSDERTGGLHIGSIMPDVIIVYLGTNDWAYGAQTEKERKRFLRDRIRSFAGGYIQGDDTVFSVAYARMLDSLRRNYPTAEIFCCTLNETCMTSDPAFVFPHSYGGIHIDQYNNIIRQAANRKGCAVIDLSVAHLPYDSVDGSHPTETGMNTLATLMLRGLCDREGLSFLECACSEHEFITAEEYSGGIKYACRKCGLVDYLDVLDCTAFERMYAGSTVNGNHIPNRNVSLSEIKVVNCVNGHFYDGSRLDCCPNCHDKNQGGIAEKKADAVDHVDPDILDLVQSCIAMHAPSDIGIQLFSVSKGEDLTICKSVIHIGREPNCDLHLSSSVISRLHATITFDGNYWMIQDNNSKNGTWLNATKLIPGKRYILHPDDIIDFAHGEQFVFFKTHQQNQCDEDAKAVAFLEAGIKMFHDSNHKDETAFKLIIATLIDAPLFLPIAIDIEAVLNGADPAKLRPGDLLQPSKDVFMKVLTIAVNNTEYVPMFTSSEEVNKGLSVSTMRMHPQDYLPKIIQMDKDVIINPFGGTAFIYTQKMIKELVWPIVELKVQ